MIGVAKHPAEMLGVFSMPAIESEYTYATADIKTYMDNFYINQLGSDTYILNTEITYRYNSSYSSDFSTYSTGTLSQKFFALDAVEAELNASKFSWDSSSKMNGSGSGFWIAAGFNNKSLPSGWLVSSYGYLSSFDINYSSYGDRPAFWISLTD